MLALITSHFNFANYERPRQNLWRFNLQMRSFGYPLYGVEAYLPDQEPFTAGWVNWKQVMVGADQIMFQKEALLNLAETIVPSEYDKIAWLDADIWFQNMKWFETTEKLLDEFKVVQLFETSYYCCQGGTPFLNLPAFVTHFTTIPNSQPGFAWAARRDLWKSYGGLYANAILGSGDLVAAAAIVGKVDIHKESIVTDFSAYQKWHQNITTWVKNKYSVVPGAIFHEWHGSRNDRNYCKRHEITRNVDLVSAIEKADNQLLTWTALAPMEVRLKVRQYFLDRKEDG